MLVLSIELVVLQGRRERERERQRERRPPAVATVYLAYAP